MPAFEGWAVVELMGHRVRYAHLSEVQMFGVPFACLDIPSDPPARQFYGGGAIYAITPTTEEAVRAYHSPRPRGFDRPTLAAATDADLVDDFDADTGGVHDDDDPEGVCGNCNTPLGTEPTQRVSLDDGSDYTVWHERCALEHAERLDDAVDSDAPTGGV